MLKISHKIYSFLMEEEAATAVEYAVMIGLIILACIGSVLTLGTATRDSVFDSVNKIGAAFGN